MRKIYFKTVKKILVEQIMFDTIRDFAELDDNQKKWLINLINQFFRNFGAIEKLLLREIEPNLEKQKFDLSLIILCATIEYFYAASAKDFAIVNEYVNLAKKIVGKSTGSFVNAILRKVVKLDKNLVDNFEIDDLKANYDEWVMAKLKLNFSKEDLGKILLYNQEIPSFYIRVNQLKTSKKKLKQKFLEEGIESENVKYFADFLKITKGNPLKSKYFAEGFFYIQEPSQSLGVLLLNPKKNEKILDLCCAPGGKATYMQELANNKVKLYLNDISQSKRVKIKHNFKRLGLSFHKLTFDEGEKFHSFEEYNKILIDAPCSGSGNYQKDPESRWNKDEEDLEKLNILQLKMLERLKIYIPVGGEIVYSTCSLFKEENEEIIKKFLENNQSDYQLAEEANEKLASFKQAIGYSVNPASHNLAGAYACKIKRVR